MKKLIFLLLITSALIYSCKDNTTEPPQSGSVLVYSEPGIYDSVKSIRGISPVAIGPETTLVLGPYSKVRITFDYKAQCDSMELDLYRWYGPTASAPLFTFKRNLTNTNGAYNSFDTTVNSVANGTGQYGHNLFVYYDTCEAVLRNFKIYGIF